MAASEAPAHGVRYLLEHVRGSDPTRYRGLLEGAVRCQLEISIVDDPSSPDGKRAVASVEGAPPELEASIARTASIMVKSAVRRAIKDGLPPPRRIQRWRQH